MEPFKIKKKKKKLLCHTWLKVKPEYHREMKGFMSHWLSLSFYAAEIKTDFNRLENKTIFKYVLTYCLNLCSQEVRSVGEISWKCLITSQSQILWPILPTEKPFCRLVYSKLWTFCSTFTSNINNLTSRLSGIIIVPWNCAYFWCCYHGGLEGRLEDKWIGSKSMCWKNLWRCWSMNCRTGIHQTQEIPGPGIVVLESRGRVLVVPGPISASVVFDFFSQNSLEILDVMFPAALIVSERDPNHYRQMQCI